jgi:hypothetical protein
LIGALGAIAMLAFIVGIASGAGGGDGPDEAAPAEAAPLVELPGGGREIFPDRRVVALYGSPGDEALGALGIGTPQQAGQKLAKQAEAYATDETPVLPAMELISTIAANSAGERGEYNIRIPAKTIDKYLDAARAMDAILILDVQPGYADFMTEVRRLEPWLREPDVSLALDPEWHVSPPDIPGSVIGSVDAADVNEVSAYLSELVAANDLPEKLLVVHQFTPDMIADKETLEEHPGVAMVLNADGFGDPPNKEAKYDELRPRGPTRQFHSGFKLFYVEDYPLMSAKQVEALKPPPEFIVYE